MRWNRALCSITIVGLVAASCGSGDDSANESIDSTPMPTSTEVTVDDSVDDGVTESTPASTSAPSTVANTVVTTTIATTTTTTSIATTTEVVVDDDPGGAEFLRLVDAGALAVSIVVPEGGVSGELLRVAFVNRSDDDVDVVLPCGLVFVPAGDETVQRMMNVTPLDVKIGQGGSIDVTPYVMCIDSSAPGPGPGASYEIGGLAPDDLLAFAQCICGEGLLDEVDPTVGDMSLQIAVWAVADGELPDAQAAIADVDGALSDMFGEEGFDLSEIAGILEAQGIDPGMLDGLDLEAMLGDAAVFFDEYLGDAEMWLDRCSIDLAD